MVIRLGDGTAESHRRAQAAVDRLFPYTNEMFAAPADEDALVAEGLVADPAALRAIWRDTVSDVLGRATLAVPEAGWMQSGGRDGRHSEHLGPLLAELQFLQRSFPGATW